MSTFTFAEGSVKLNEEQARIVRSPPKQNLRILASAGSGKTTTLTARISWLIANGASASQILLMTFTHNAAAVMRQRLEGLIGSQRILCGTFHAIGLQILNEHAPETLQDVYHIDEVPLKTLDFLQTPKGIDCIKKLRWIFIDEYQDINDTQYNIIRVLHHSEATITIVGDDAQNIYTWRGSCVDYILNFHKKFPEVHDFQLSTNYRSTSAIVAVANSIMRYIPTLPHKELMTSASEQGDRPEVRYFSKTSEERDWVVDTAAILAKKGESVVILSKFNSVLYAYEAELLKYSVHARFVHGEEIPTQNQNQTQNHTSKSKSIVYLSTFHGSKGLEWDNVFLVRMNDEVFPQKKDEDSILQERRLFYVAVTRARKSLTFTYSRTEKSLSRFIREIHRPLLVWKNLPCYELSTLSSEIQLIHVRDWVNYLTGEDYRNIKHLNMLPPVFKDPSAFKLSEKSGDWCIPYLWVEKGMAAEFYDFLRAFVHREVGVLRPDSGGLWDRDAQRIIWTIKICAEDAAIFLEHRDLFEKLADHFFGSTPRGERPPTIYYQDVLAALAIYFKKHNQFDQATNIRIIQIVNKMRTVLYNLRFVNVSLSDFQLAPIRHVPPNESRCQLIEAWRTYTDGKPLQQSPTLYELNSIYRIGLCRAVGEGRAGVLSESQMPGEMDWVRIRPFLSNLQKKIQSIVSENKSISILCREQKEITAGVFSSIDMVVGETAWFFVPGDQVSDIRRLDRMLIALLSVLNTNITRICMYQLITGVSIEWSIEDWSPESRKLLLAYIQARVEHNTN
jgi:hypothetical protein